MQRIAKPATNKADFELFCVAVSAINGCEACVRSHEHVVLEGGLSEDNVHDAVRIAAVIHTAPVALDISLPPARQSKENAFYPSNSSKAVSSRATSWSSTHRCGAKRSELSRWLM